MARWVATMSCSTPPCTASVLLPDRCMISSWNRAACLDHSAGSGALGWPASTAPRSSEMHVVRSARSCLVRRLASSRAQAGSSTIRAS